MSAGEGMGLVLTYSYSFLNICDCILCTFIFFYFFSVLKINLINQSVNLKISLKSQSEAYFRTHGSIQLRTGRLLGHIQY